VVWPEVAEVAAVTEQEQEPGQEQAREQEREPIALAKSSLTRRSFDNRYHRNP